MLNFRKSHLTGGVIFVFLFCFLIHGAVFAQDSSVSSLKPSAGGPGTTVIVYGRNFGDVMGKGLVKFGSVEARVISWSHNAISVIVPNNLKNEDLAEMGGKRKRILMPISVVLNSGEVLAGPGFDVAPALLKLSPKEWAPGRKIRATGYNFGDFGDLGRVTVAGTKCEIVSWNDRQVEFILPPSIDPKLVMTEKQKKGHQKRYVEIVITAGNLESEKTPLYLDLSLDGFSPAHSCPGGIVELKGNGFGTGRENVRVIIGKRIIEPVKVAGDKVEFVMPKDLIESDLSDGRVQVSIKAGEIETNSLFIPVAPIIKSVKPSRGDGRHIVIHGRGFGNGSESQVRIVSGKIAADALVSGWTPDAVTVRIPDGFSPEGDEATLTLTVVVSGLSSKGEDYRLIPVKKTKSGKGAKKGE